MPELRWERARTQHLAGRGPQPRRLPSAFEAARCEQQRRPVPPSQGPEEDAVASEEEEGAAGWRRGDRSPGSPDAARVSPPAERSPVRRQPPGKRGLSLRRRCQEGRARRTEVGVCVWGPSEVAVCGVPARSASSPAGQGPRGVAFLSVKQGGPTLPRARRRVPATPASVGHQGKQSVSPEQRSIRVFQICFQLPLPSGIV